MKVEAPLGDVVDKVTILQIKLDEIGTENVQKELGSLLESWRTEALPSLFDLPQFRRLSEVNRALWDVEDALRLCESEQEFGETFIQLARSVYVLNDERAALKQAINLDLGSKLIEEKSYSVTRNTNR